MTPASPLPTPDTRPISNGAPVLTKKWSMVNEHWIEAQFLLARTASGLSDRPADERALSANGDAK